MEYKRIFSFLEKFKKILFKKEEIYRTISRVIFVYTKITLEINSIKIKNDIIYIQSSPILKNEILIHKKEILLDFKKLIIGYNITDIK